MGATAEFLSKMQEKESEEPVITVRWNELLFLEDEVRLRRYLGIEEYTDSESDEYGSYGTSAIRLDHYRETQESQENTEKSESFFRFIFHHLDEFKEMDSLDYFATLEKLGKLTGMDPKIADQRELLLKDFYRLFFHLFWLSDECRYLYYAMHDDGAFNVSSDSVGFSVKKSFLDSYSPGHSDRLPQFLSGRKTSFEDIKFWKDLLDYYFDDLLQITMEINELLRNAGDDDSVTKTKVNRLLEKEQGKICDLCTYSENGILNLTSFQMASKKDEKVSLLLNYLLSKAKFCVCNDQLYQYEPKFAYYRLLKNSNDEESMVYRLFPSVLQKYLSAPVVKETLFRLKRLSNLNVAMDFFNKDKDGTLVNCQNGIYNIKDGSFEAHKGSDHEPYHFSYCNDAKYKDEEVKASKIPTFKSYVEKSLGYDGAEDYLLRIIGDLCSPNLSYKVAFFFIGKPDSGKTKISGLIKNIIGNDNVSGITFHQLSDRFSNSVLSNHRLNINMELSSAPIRDTSRFKTIVGGDFAEGEFKGKDLYSFHYQCKLLFGGNTMPLVTEYELLDAFLNKVVFLYFPKSVAVKDQDLQLEDKLKKEKNFIYTLAMRAVSKTYADKNREGKGYNDYAPKECVDFRKKYRSSVNIVKDFSDSCCEFDPLGENGYSVSNSELYQAFRRYAYERGLKNPPGQKGFAKKFGEYTGIISSAIHEGVRGYRDVRLKTALTSLENEESPETSSETTDIQKNDDFRESEDKLSNGIITLSDIEKDLKQKKKDKKDKK